MDLLPIIELTPVHVNYGSYYVDGARKIDYDKIESFDLAFSAEEWVSLCSREGEYYVGGCCGTTSYLQDFINDAFRDHFLDGHTLIQMARLACDHEGFDEFNKSEEELIQLFQNLPGKRAEEKWNKLDPWQKLGVLYVATKDKLKLMSFQNPSAYNKTTIVNNAMNMLTQLEWKQVMSGDGATHSPCAQVLTLKAGILAPMKELIEYLEKDAETWEGFAIVDSENNLTTTGLGTSLFDEKEKAETVMEYWRKSEEERKDKARPLGRIVRAKVSVEDGFEILGEIED